MYMCKYTYMELCIYAHTCTVANACVYGYETGYTYIQVHTRVCICTDKCDTNSCTMQPARVQILIKTFIYICRTHANTYTCD